MLKVLAVMSARASSRLGEITERRFLYDQYARLALGVERLQENAERPSGHGTLRLPRRLLHRVLGLDGFGVSQ